MKFQVEKNQKIYAALILSLLLISYYSSVVFGGKTFIPTIQRTYKSGHYHYSGSYWHQDPGKVSVDPAAAAQIILPSAYMEHHYLKKFKLPLWNPYSGIGRPYHADMNSYTFFIPIYLFKLFPSLLVYDIFLLFRLFFAGFFFFLLLRLYRCSFWISMAGASFFMFNSYFHAYINMDHLNVVMFLPALAYFTTKFIFSGKISYLGGFILCSSGSFYGGNPNEFLLIHIFISLYSIFLILFLKKRNLRKQLNFLLIFIGSLLFSLLLSSLKFIPFFEFWKSSISSRTLGTVGSNVYLSLKQLLWQLLAPHQIREGPNYGGYLILSLSFFALFSLVQKRWKLKEKLVAFHGVILFLTVSKILGAPYINWIGKLPVLKSIHFVKYCSILFFSFSILAAFSLKWLTESIKKNKTRGLKIGTLFFSFFLPHFLFWAFFQRTLFQASIHGSKLVRIFILSAFFSFIILFLKKNLTWKTYINLGVIVLALLTILELRFNNIQNYGERFKINDKAPYTQFLLQKKQPHRSFGLDFTFMPNCNLVYPIPSLNRLFAMRLKRPALLLSQLVNPKFNSGMGHRYSKKEVLHNPYLDLINTEYYISESILDSIIIDPVYANNFNIKSLVDNPFIQYTRCGSYFHYFHTGWQQWADSTIDIPLCLPEESLHLAATGLAFNFDKGKRKSPENKLHLIISVIYNSQKEIIYKREFSPLRKKDVGFFPLKADLTPYSGKKVVLRLTLKNPHPCNKNDRSFFYGNLRIVPYRLTHQETFAEACKSIEKKPYEEAFFHHALIYKNHNAMSRGFMLYNFKQIQGISGAIKTLKKNPQIYKHTALIEGNPPQKMMLGKKGKSKITFVDYQPNLININIHTTEDGIFTLSDAYYPGWKAFLDEEEVKIYPAFGALRAVFIPKGKHNLVFSYRPQTFYLSFALTLISLILAGYIFFIRPNQKIRGDFI